MRWQRVGELVVLALLLAGCAAPWQAPAGTSPAEQARDWDDCQAQAEQVTVGQAAQVDVVRMQTLTQCLEARGWRQGGRAGR
jgi:S-methylmethionine-dependent homocysteine/selenocysteine methylase